jgi:hypothetical protein
MVITEGVPTYARDGSLSKHTNFLSAGLWPKGSAEGTGGLNDRSNEIEPVRVCQPLR